MSFEVGSQNPSIPPSREGILNDSKALYYNGIENIVWGILGIGVTIAITSLFALSSAPIPISFKAVTIVFMIVMGTGSTTLTAVGIHACYQHRMLLAHKDINANLRIN